MRLIERRVIRDIVLLGGVAWILAVLVSWTASQLQRHPFAEPYWLLPVGLGDVEFARELFEELNVLSVEDRAAWATIFRSARLPEGAA